MNQIILNILSGNELDEMGACFALLHRGIGQLRRRVATACTHFE